MERELPINKRVLKPQLDKVLKDHLAGVARCPALSFHREDQELRQLNLGQYEVSPIEPLHDTKGHIKNIWDVMPEILTADEKKLFLEILEGCYGNKDKVRGCDYRLSTILVYNNMKNKCRKKVEELLLTLMETVKLTYMPSKHRTPKYILRLHNVTFKHALLCMDVLGKKPKKITSEKLYGIYFHAITSHLPQVARIISPSSLHTENEERLFSAINQISLSTSSRKSDSIRDNSIIRLQAEQKLQQESNITSTSQSMISKFSRTIGM